MSNGFQESYFCLFNEITNIGTILLAKLLMWSSWTSSCKSILWYFMHKIAKTRVLEIKDTSRVSCIVNPVYRGKYVNRFRFFFSICCIKDSSHCCVITFRLTTLSHKITRNHRFMNMKKKNKKYRVPAFFLSNNRPVKIILTQFVSYVDKLQ